MAKKRKMKREWIKVVAILVATIMLYFFFRALNFLTNGFLKDKSWLVLIVTGTILIILLITGLVSFRKLKNLA